MMREISKIKPSTISDVIGQQHLIGPNGPITKMIENDTLTSMILHGPPGIGKTTIANIIANESNAVKVSLNAAISSKSEFEEAVKLIYSYDKVVVIIDEIHRLDIRKQDFLLPYLERESFFIIGTTTQNPYYDVTSAIRSRSLIFELLPISNNDLLVKLKAICEQQAYNLDDALLKKLILIGNGDVRQTLNIITFLVKNYTVEEINEQLLKELFPNNVVSDKTGDNHHNLLSALQKSIRASDVDAAMHYSARLLQVGDYKSLLRRLIVIAYEDISIANPQLCARVVSAVEAFERVGMPEARIIIATIVTDMSLSPKTNTPYINLANATADIEKYNITDVHEMIKYNQNEDNQYSPELAKRHNLLPKQIKDRQYFTLSDNSKYEAALSARYKMLKRDKR